MLAPTARASAEGGTEAGASSETGASGWAAANHFHSALLAVGAAEPRLFCRAMGDHAVQMGGPHAGRIAAVNAVIALVKTRSVNLVAELVRYLHCDRTRAGAASHTSEQMMPRRLVARY